MIEAAEIKRHVVLYKSGQYEKLGGGRTDDLQEAQVIGWKSRSRMRGRWEDYGARLVPVRIIVLDQRAAPDDAELDRLYGRL